MLTKQIKSAAIILGLVAMYSNAESSVRTGLDRVGSHKEVFDGKRLGIITNHTAYNIDGK